MAVPASTVQLPSDSPEPPFTIEEWPESKFHRDGVFNRITNQVFKKENLDRQLDRCHITGAYLLVR